MANFDLICTLPLPADLIALATHPTIPLLVAGFASGFVHAYRLPNDQSSTAEPVVNGDATSSRTSSKSDSHHVKFSSKLDYQPQKPDKTKKLPRRSSLSSALNSPPPAGHSTIENVWKTRRHKGSCRALAFSTDGRTLFSVGTDGIIKAADAETGHVIGKAIVPNSERSIQPSRLLALNPRLLILGDDEGGVHEYELHEALFKKAAGQTRCAPVKVEPQKTHYPHRTEAHPDAAEPVTSLTALPPSGASTSNISRAWISTAGSTLAVCDAFKGVVACSEEQGGGKAPLELLSCACLKRSKKVAQQQGDSAKRKRSAKTEEIEDESVLVVGDSSGGCSTWTRGRWTDKTGHTNIRRYIKIPGLPFEDFSVDSVAIAPISEQDSIPLIVAGLAIGRIHFLRVGSQDKPTTLQSEYPHDDQGLDGCASIAFDAHGRMVTGGGPMIKIWRRKFESSEVAHADGLDFEADAEEAEEAEDVAGDHDMASTVNGMTDANGSEKPEEVIDPSMDAGDSSSDEPKEPVRRRETSKSTRKQRKTGKRKDDGRGDHGILKVKGL